jgi:hypothetical protein
MKLGLAHRGSKAQSVPMLEPDGEDKIWTDAYGAFNPATLAYAITRVMADYLRAEQDLSKFDAAMHCLAACDLAKAGLLGHLMTGKDPDDFGRR